jgi:hypothetical protein
MEEYEERVCVRENANVVDISPCGFTICSCYLNGRTSCLMLDLPLMIFSLQNFFYPNVG